MENPYGHDHWCNLMTAHSEQLGGRGETGEATGRVDRRWWGVEGGWSGRMGDEVLGGGREKRGRRGDPLSSRLAGWC